MSITSYTRRIKCVTMENPCNIQELDFQSVFEVVNEPAVVINGVPDVTASHTSTIFDTTGNQESVDNPCFGDWLEGRKVQKFLLDKVYTGKVDKYDKNTNCYRAAFDDGSFEDLEWHDLEAILMPLDISIPLTTLASKRCILEKSVSGRITPNKGRKNHTSSPKSKRKASELPQTSQAGLQKDDKKIHSYTTTSNIHNVQKFDSTHVYEVNGEPAIVVNGVPNMTPGPSTTIMDTMDNNLNQNNGQDVGELLEGRKVQKWFSDRFYLGEVEKYDKETKWYRVVYEDGDFEDLEWHELENVLVPLDISSPATTIASRLSKVEESKYNEARQNMNISGRAKNANLLDGTVRERCRDRSLQMQEGIVIESIDVKMAKPVDVNVSEGTPDGILQMHEGSLIESIDTHLQITEISKHVDSPIIWPNNNMDYKCQGGGH